MWRGAGHIASAPAAIVLVVPVPPDERRVVTDNYDVGHATMAMMIAVAFMLGIGYPADRPLTPIRKPNRRPFDEVVHRGRW